MTTIDGFLDRNLTMAATVTRVREGDDRDDMNRPVSTEESERTVTFAWPETGDETAQGLEVSTGRYLAVFRSSVDLASTDRVSIDNLGTFEVDGPPRRYTPLRGASPAMQIVALVVTT